MLQKQPLKPNNLILLFIFLVMLISGPEFATDMYIPSLPSIATHFAIFKPLAAMTITAFLLGQAVFQLFYGGYSDHHGRKKTLIIGTLIVLAGSLISMLAPNITTLFIGRTIQGAGAGVGLSMTLAIARDSYEGPALAKALSILFTFYFIVFACAPIIGGYLAHYISWRSNFIILSIYFLIQLLWTLLLFNETHQTTHDNEKGKLKKTMANYARVLKNRVFLGNVFAASLAFSSMFAYAAITPFLFQKELHLTTIEYGWLSIFIAIGLLLSSLTSGKLVEKYGLQKPNRLVLVLFFISSIVMLILALMHILNIWVVMVPYTFFVLGIGIVGITCSTNALSQFGDAAGSAGALWGFVQFMILSVASIVYAHLSAKTQLSFAVL